MTSAETPIKINLLDNSAVKRTIDDEFIKSFRSFGYKEDHSVTNYKLLFGFFACIAGLLAQFYPVPLKQAKPALIGLILLYFIFHGLMNLVGRLMQDKFAIMWIKADQTKKLPRLEVCAKMDRDSPELVVGYVDLQTKRKLERVWQVTEYFDSTGVFLQSKFREQVQKQLDDFLASNKKQ